MAQFNGLTLWTDAWIADTKHLSRLERGTYHDLLVLMWRSPGCRVPNDDVWLSKHMRMTPTEVANELRPIIVEFCKTDGNWIVQQRLQKEFVRVYKIHVQRTDAANSRWGKEKGLSKRIAKVSRAAYAANGAPAMQFKLDKKKASLNGENQHRPKTEENSPTEPAAPEEASEKKKPEELTLAEINRLRYGKPNP